MTEGSVWPEMVRCPFLHFENLLNLSENDIMFGDRR